MSYIVPEEIEKYAFEHTQPEDPTLQEIAKFTWEKMDSPQMLTGRLEGRFLHLLVKLTGARKVLEVGMFTGYGTLSMASALPESGELYTCEMNSNAIEVAEGFFAKSPHGKKIHILAGPALDSLKQLNPSFDLVFIDADKANYPLYYEEALRLLTPGGVIVVDNVLWSGRVIEASDQEASTKAIRKLNEIVTKDDRVENALLTIRDGVQLIRKK